MKKLLTTGVILGFGIALGWTLFTFVWAAPTWLLGLGGLGIAVVLWYRWLTPDTKEALSWMLLEVAAGLLICWLALRLLRFWRPQMLVKKYPLWLAIAIGCGWHALSGNFPKLAGMLKTFAVWGLFALAAFGIFMVLPEAPIIGLSLTIAGGLGIWWALSGWAGILRQIRRVWTGNHERSNVA